VNLLPFAGIGRVMFLYHYFPALVFAILALAYLLDRTPAPRRSHAAVLAAAFLAFLFFAPLSYGLPLSPPAYRARVWLATWQ
jgi:dolichyl-phosphate-mannose-protein mannosyltransferase